jgi:hypothetical protein
MDDVPFNTRFGIRVFQNRIHSLKEQFEMDLSDLLQRGDIGVDTGMA